MKSKVTLDWSIAHVKDFENALQDYHKALDIRTKLTELIEYGQQYSVGLYMDRQKVYEALGYPDLAAMDAYKASLLIDELQDEDAEYHEQAQEALEHYLGELSSRNESGYSWCKHITSVTGPAAEETAQLISNGSLDKAASEWVIELAIQAPLTVALHLGVVGCLRTALTHISMLGTNFPNHASIEQARANLQSRIEKYYENSSNRKPLDQNNQLKVDQLPDQGSVRREVYPWSNHESERHAAKAIALLNSHLALVAPKLEVRVAELPILGSTTNLPHPGTVATGNEKTVLQLGVFAKEDISPGELILTERSMLTANARLHEPLCDACSARLPNGPMSGNSCNDGEPVACGDCDDVVFCSQQCHNLAQASYHPAVCGTDNESLAKEVPSQEAANALYTQLIFRALSLAKTQDVHPLDLMEVKYIWGDFTSNAFRRSSVLQGEEIFEQADRTLPFTFNAQVLQPIHWLLSLDLSPFDSGPLGEAWVYNTLYAKLRGTASARISEHDGRPEVAAVHPLWCLANHSCDPNVTWDWAGEIKFYTRDKRATWSRGTDHSMTESQTPKSPGIRKDEEVLSHYVDIELGVNDRREWGRGSLGGDCMCERCLWESQPDGM